MPFPAAVASYHPAMRRSALLLAVLALVLAGCQDRNRWTEEDARVAQAKPPANPDSLARDARIMLFAPTDPGPLAAIHPDARLDFPHRMATRVDVLMRDWDGRVGEILPESGAKRWEEGRVPATGGTHVVVLTRVLDLRRIAGQPGVAARPDRVEALAEVRALDVAGRTIWRRKASAEADVPTSPKTVTPAARPESRAAYDALDAGLGALRQWLATQPDLTKQPQGGIEPAAATLVAVEIDSDPKGADVLIDGVYRGTTPQKLKLPPRALTVRIERQGHQPWERTLSPEEGMRIQPVLLTLGAPAPAEPAAPVPAQP